VNERFASALRLLPDYLSQHVLLSAAALALGVAVSLPLTVAASRSPAVRWPVLGFASVIQTVPSLALLALFYPLLLGISSVWRHLFGFGFAALGFLPSLLALTLYSMLPILRNGVTAIVGLDPAIVQAARGVGMTRRQRLWRVELPLAAPMIMAGVRTAAVWVIGTATLATPVGQTSLGNYIFSGLQVEDWVWVLFGCGVAVALAIVTDQLLALVELGVARRRPRLAWLGVGLLLAGVAAAGSVPLAAAGGGGYVVGAKNFSEQYTLAALIAERIRDTGHPASERTDLGSTIAFRALAADELDVYVDYSGTLWSNILHRTDTLPRAQMLQVLRQELRRRYGVELLGALGFENAYVLAMRSSRAESLGVHSIADLARVAPELTLGGDLEFFARPEWHALETGYGLAFRARREYQPTFMYRALMSGDVDVITAFSSDGRIAADHLTVLQDPRHAIPPYDAVVLLSPRRAHDPVLRAALQPLIGAIPVGLMRQANYLVDRPNDKLTPAQAARWLERAAHLRGGPAR
jgi:osmoprotectant transport system substrate-binding protein/osmoprotectant transport system permease protein